MKLSWRKPADGKPDQREALEDEGIPGYLEDLRVTPLETFMTDFKASGAAERYMHLATEAIIDIGNEIISALQLRRPERYREIPRILAEADIIPADFTDDIAKMIGFRNLLVHDYASIDRTLEHEFLKTRSQILKNM